VGLFLVLLQNSSAESVWQSQQKYLGHVKAEGGWDVRYQLGSMQMGAEAQILLLLGYNSIDEDKSNLFRGQWSCPQLESSVIPVGKEVMRWVRPGGDVLWFTPDPKDKGNYSSLANDWRMTFKSNKTTLIFNEQGWVYVYQDGVLISVESPTGRALNFIYSRGDLLRVELTDADSIAKPVILIACAYDDDHRCVQMEIGSLLHKFVYEKKTGGRLIGWDQPNGQSLNFYYNDAGVLSEVEQFKAGLINFV
jgi:YD repeat-containing protein